jgi:glucose-1-phosphate thymidylyltransferase
VVPSGVTLVDPVRIADDVTLVDCTIGPHVTIESGTRVSGAMIRNSIIGADCRISGSVLVDTMLGDHVTLERFTGSASLGSHATLHGDA